MDDGAHTGGVQHHYMHGLCFDGMWDYHTRSRKGRKSWARLDLGSDAYPWAQEDDPEGAGWCVRCCASVLGQRPVPLTHMQNSPTPTGDPASVAFALRELLPKFEVDVQLCTGQNVIQDVEKVIKDGGSMLVRLKRASGVRQIPPSWMWIVGVELRPVARCALGAQGTPKTPALLLVGRGLEPSWASGYGVKAICEEDALWSVRSVDGQTWSAVVSCVVRISPK